MQPCLPAQCSKPVPSMLPTLGRWLALPTGSSMRLQQHPRDALPCVARPVHGAGLPAGFTAPPVLPDAMARSAAAVLRGLGARAGGCGADLLSATPDGLPLLGSHAGFEEGRVIVAAAAGGDAIISPKP